MPIILDKEDVEPGSALNNQVKAGAVVREEAIEGGTPPEPNPPTPTPTPPAEPTPPTSPSPPVPPTPPTPPTPDGVKPEEVEQSVIESVFGKKLSKSEAKALVEQLPGLASQLEEYRTKQVKFASPYVEGLNDYLAKGGSKEVYDRVQSLDLENLNGIDAIKAKYKWDHPELTDAQIDLKLSKKYSQYEDAPEEDKDLGLVDITIDAKEAKKELLKIKQEKSIPDPERLRVEEEANELKRITSFKPVTEGLAKDFNGLDITLSTDKDGKPVDVFKFSEISEDFRKDLAKDLQEIVERLDLPYSAESVDGLKEVLQERVILRAFPKIAQAIFTDTSSKVEKRVRAEYQNSTPPPVGDPPPSGTKKSAEDALYEKDFAYVSGNSK